MNRISATIFALTRPAGLAATNEGASSRKMVLTKARAGHTRRRPLPLIVLLCTLLGVTLLRASPATTVYAAGTLLSQNQPASASSVESAGTPAASAVDGPTTTRWSSQFSDPQWLSVDLGRVATISQVVLQWEAAYGKQYQIQVSTDATTWTTIYTQANSAGGTETLTVSGSGRYVRLYGTQRATAYGYSLWEFQVYGSLTASTATPTAVPTNTPPAGGCGTTNVALNRPATASSSENAGTPAGSAVDGNTTTRWSSQFSDPQWLQVDLGSVQSICKVVLQWEAAYGKQYQIQVSSDAATWTTIYTQSNGAGGIETLTISGSGRYVRLYGTQRATAYGYSLWELQVYGGSGPVPTATPTTVPTVTPGPNWTLVWSDEFNGPAGATPDATKWTPDVGGSGNGNSELEYNTNNNNTHMDGTGNLVIEARKENPANYQCWYGGCTYTSGRITTQNKFSYTYGKIEARIKIPYGQGLWPAFWLLGANINTVPWPTCGEIDVMENIGREPGTVHGTVHGPGYSGSNGIGGPYTLPNNQAFSSAYHTFGVQWDANNVVYSVDGTTYFTVTRAMVESHGQWVYDHPFFIILNVAVGGAWPGNPDGTTVFPQRMSLDYVRVYQ